MFQGTKKNENLCKFITPTVQYGFIMEISILTHHRMMFSHEVMSDSLWPNGLQYTRFPCPSLSPRIWSNSYTLNWWWNLTISFSVNLFSFCPQSFPESASFQMSLLFSSGCQSIGASALASVFPVNIQCWFPLRLTGLISLLSKGFSQVFSSTRVQKHPFCSVFFTV